MIPPNQLEDYEAKVRNNFRQGKRKMNNSQKIENGKLIMKNYQRYLP